MLIDRISIRYETQTLRSVSTFCPEEVDYAPVAPKLGSEVKKSLGFSVNGFVKPVHHRAANAGMWVHVLARNTGLAIAYSAVLSILFFSLCVFNIHVNLILNDLCKFFLR